MAALLDTAQLAGEDRLEAFRTTMMELTGSTRVEPEVPPGGVSARMDLWSFGAARIFATESTGVSMVRDVKAARGTSPEVVAVAVHGLGVGRHETSTHQQVLRTGELMVVDITRPYDFSWTGNGSSTSLQIPIDELHMPMDAVQKAAGRLRASPLYRLAGRHLIDLTRDAETLSASAVAPALGEASTQLVRALLAGAAGDGALVDDVLEQTLSSQIRVYVRQHLRDPTLGADSIAAALAVSRRQLYRACTRDSFSLEQYIIAKRLEGARSELESPASRSRSIATIAFRWGFKDPTHFARRFKLAYGLLPRDWRHRAEEPPT